jgi:sugar diacid utilization regulator
MSELQDVVDSLAARIGRSVAIDDQRFRLAVFSAHTQEIDDVRRTSILRREAPQTVTDLLRTLGVQNASGPMRIEAVTELGLRPRVCIPIRFDGLLLGYMWLVEDATRLDDEQLALCAEAARDAAPLMYRERILEDQTRERERRCVTDLLDLANERRAGPAQVALEEGILAAAGAYGVIVIEAADPSHRRADERAVTILAALERVRRGVRPHSCIAGNVGGRGVLIAGVRSGDHGAREMARIADGVSRDLRGYGGERDACRIGLGPAVRDLARVVLSYRAALDANQIAMTLPQVGAIADWNELGAWKLLCLIPDDDRAHYAIHPALAQLSQLRDGGALLETVRLYLDHAGDAQATADLLHIHRTSLYARLRRIEREAGVDLSSGEDRLALHVSVRLLSLRGEPALVEGTQNVGVPS